jgi:hypothetical protein
LTSSFLYLRRSSLSLHLFLVPTGR